MPDVHEVFRLVAQEVDPELGALERQYGRQRRASRNRKAGALATAAIIVAAIALFAATTMNRSEGNTPASVSPNGPGLAFTVVGLDGTVRSSVAALPAGAMQPAISPDGATIVFVVEDNGITQIATMRLDSGEFHVVTNGSTSVIRPRWSPDGRQLVFYRTSPTGPLRLMVMDADGTNVREVSGTHFPDDVPADWSPDGTRFIYTSMVGGVDDLATIPVSGGESQPLTNTPNIDESGVAWSPDGSLIAYKRAAHPGLQSEWGDWEIWLMNADGHGRHRLAAMPHANAEAPAWSPDGSKVAFIVSGEEYQHGAVFIVDIATGTITEVVQAVAVGSDRTIDARATWTPDGGALLVMTGTTR